MLADEKGGEKKAVEAGIEHVEERMPGGEVAPSPVVQRV
jgi:hypothetical protein